MKLITQHCFINLIINKTIVFKHLFSIAILCGFLIILSFNLTFGSPKDDPKYLPVNKWKETKRIRLDSSLISFSDTMFLSFKAKGDYTYRNNTGFTFNGNYSLTDRDLNLGNSRFTISVNSPISLVLKNSSGISFFKIDTIDSLKPKIETKEEKTDTVTSLNQIIGRWNVYKCDSNKKTDSLSLLMHIKTIYITGSSTEGKQGYIFTEGDKTNEPTAIIRDIKQGMILECEGKGAKTKRLLKCKKGEMIIEDDDTKYYLKQFK